MENKEIEFKYIAKASLLEFTKFCESIGKSTFLTISGTDHFYANPRDIHSFYRHRVNTNENQLTFKRKLNPIDNFIRDEYNIDLPNSVSKDKIEALCSIHGYVYNTSIFKNCFIYQFHNYTLVYYICYDDNLRELGRFIEIEMKEDFGWETEQIAYTELVKLETMFSNLGLSSEGRIMKSLFELYRK